MLPSKAAAVRAQFDAAEAEERAMRLRGRMDMNKFLPNSESEEDEEELFANGEAAGGAAAAPAAGSRAAAGRRARRGPQAWAAVASGTSQPAR